MTNATRLIATCLSVTCLASLCGCGTFPMSGNSKLAIFKAYSGPQLPRNEMATIKLSKQDGVWVSQLDGQTVRFGPFPPMGAWQEIVFEVAPGSHELKVESLATGSASYDPNTGRFQHSGAPSSDRSSLVFAAEAGRSYVVKRFYIEDAVSGKPVPK